MVSVVLPTHNRRHLLPAAIESVRAQSFQDWELLVVDDGSTDGTWSLLEGLEDSRIRIFRQQHRGVSRARNLAIRESRSVWLGFLDSDDRWTPTKLQRQLEALEEHPELQICHTDEVWIRRGVRVNPKHKHQKYGGWIYHRCLPLCLISPSSVLLQRRLLLRRGAFDENFPVCEDYELWLRLTSQFPVLFVPEPLVFKYGGHADQLSRSRWGLDRYRISALIKIHEGGQLSYQQGRWTAQEIVRKARILAKGFAKRGKLSASDYFELLALRWRGRAGSPL